MSDNIENYTTLPEIARHCQVSDRTISRLFETYNKMSDIQVTGSPIVGQDKRKKFYLIATVNRALSFGGYPQMAREAEITVSEVYVDSGPLALRPPSKLDIVNQNVEGIQHTQKMARRAFNDNAHTLQSALVQEFKATFQRVKEQGVAAIEVAAANAIGDLK